VSSRRLAAPTGTRIDRSRTVSFTFNGRRHVGFAGDTLASALLAGGTTWVGRSFKLHRPRGIFSCGVEEPNALVDVVDAGRRTPNVRATLLAIREGMRVESVNAWPTLHFDLGAINGRFAALLPAGFYYKTFKWPNWHLYEPSIRRMAGLGRAAVDPDPDRYEEINTVVDVLVVGGGPSGLTAAIAAARAGAQVLLINQSLRLGGGLGWRGDPSCASLETQAAALGIEVLNRTVAFGVFDHNLVAARQELLIDAERSANGKGVLCARLWKIRARRVIAAAGAFERPMVFPDNDRPGVMLAGAADKYAHAYGVACGERVVIAANSDHAYRVAESLCGLGIDVAAIVDRRGRDWVAACTASAATPHRVIHDAVIHSVNGSRAVNGCTLGSILPGTRAERIECDAILSAGGFAPAVHLHSQAGGRLRWLEESSMFVPAAPLEGFVSVGACAGVFDRDALLEHADHVGAAVARRLTPPAPPIGGAGRSVANTHVARRGAKQFIDLQNDVTAADVGLAAAEQYRSVEHLKRYTTTGMGTDQGKTSNVNALVLMGELTQRAPAAVGTTKFRPPFVPITLGVLAGRRTGRLYRPLKRLPAECWHESRGAAFEEYGGWWRPAAYPRQGESIAAASLREAIAVRGAAGVFDGSPLGKLELHGPDAARFLDLMYVGTMSTLAVGQARYGALLNENGVVVDDGIVARLGPQHFWINTSSGGAERTAAAFEEWLQCEYVDLKVFVTPVTSQWANVTVAGPRAWDWLCAAGFDDAIAPARMKHMAMREGVFDGVAIRVLRASFSGELGYEINISAGAAHGVLARLSGCAAAVGAVSYGVEALQIMRVEKGYIHIGSDTDGTTLPQDIGLARALARKESDFAGRRSLGRPAALDPHRPQLVGLVPADRRSLIPVGAHIALSAPPTRAEGHVTSSVMSAVLGHPVALAMLSNGAARVGERVRAYHLKTAIDAEVVKLPFVDPLGERLRG
jgi:sarcosine oxidase subunit alpha